MGHDEAAIEEQRPPQRPLRLPLPPEIEGEQPLVVAQRRIGGAAADLLLQPAPGPGGLPGIGEHADLGEQVARRQGQFGGGCWRQRKRRRYRRGRKDRLGRCRWEDGRCRGQEHGQGDRDGRRCRHRASRRPVGDRARQGDRAQPLREGGIGLGMAEQQPSFRSQALGESPYDAVHVLGAEIDQHVAAQDQVEAARHPLRSVDQAHQVLPLEAHHGAEGLAQGVASLRQARPGGGAAEPAGALFRVEGAQGPGAVFRGAGGRQRRSADVGAEDRHGPVAERLAQEVAHEDGDGIGLRPGRAARAPDPQGAGGAPRGDQVRQDRPAQGRELLGVAEEEGLADRDLGFERRPFLPARGSVQKGEIGGAVGDCASPHALAQAVVEQVVLVLVVIVTGARDHPLLQGRKVRIGQGPFRAPAPLGGAGHGEEP